jgi:hypothetical protein
MIPIVILPAISTILLLAVSIWVIKVWQEKASIKNEIDKIKNLLEFKRKLGTGLLIISFANLIDLESMFPFPFVGMQSAYFSGLLIICGSWLLFQHSRPKVAEILALAEKTQGYLTEVVIMTKLGLSHKLVKRTVRRMQKDGLLIILNPAKDQVLAEILFLVRSYSGVTRNQSVPSEASAQTAVEPEQRDEEIRRSHQEVVDLGVDEVSRRLFAGTLHVGLSGRPA